MYRFQARSYLTTLFAEVVWYSVYCICSIRVPRSPGVWTMSCPPLNLLSVCPPSSAVKRAKGKAGIECGKVKIFGSARNHQVAKHSR